MRCAQYHFRPCGDKLTPKPLSVSFGETMSQHTDASLPEIVAFVTVAQTGSFTRAAEQLGTGKSNVGKAVQRLESRLNTKLFQRTTRAVRLTEDGETYLQAAQTALDGLRDAELSLAARKDEPIGRVRLDLPAGFGRLLLPVLQAVREKHPKITFDLALSDRFSDAVAEGWDLVVRIGALPQDSEMTVRKLGELRMGLYASPDYLKRKGQIVEIADLTLHDALIFRGPTGKLRPWDLRDSDHTRDLAPPPVLVVTDGQALIDATVGGMGISQLLDRVAVPHVKAGRLVHVLPDTDVPGPAVHALIPLGRKMPAKTRTVLNAIADYLQSLDS